MDGTISRLGKHQFVGQGLPREDCPVEDDSVGCARPEALLRWKTSASAISAGTLVLIVFMVLYRDLFIPVRHCKEESRQIPEVSSLYQKNCYIHARNGICYDDVLQSYHKKFASGWKSKVDLIVRTHHSKNMFLVPTLLRSIELFWPVGILGEVIFVLDDTPEDRLYAAALPSWVKVVHQRKGVDVKGYCLQQWSLFWSDNYTDKPYFAIADDDMVFHQMVTPETLFDEEGKPYIIGSIKRQATLFSPAAEFFLGKDQYKANFMASLPNIYPTNAFASFRRHIEDRHSEGLGDFNSIFEYYSHMPVQGHSQTGQSLIGNYLWHFFRHEMHFIFMEEKEIPVMRVATHVAHSWRLKSELLGHEGKYHEHFLKHANSYLTEGLCDSFPPGQLLLTECKPTDLMAARVWTYADWMRDWYQFRLVERAEEQDLMAKRAALATERFRRYLCHLWAAYYELGIEGHEPVALGKDLFTTGNISCHDLNVPVSSLGGQD